MRGRTLVAIKRLAPISLFIQVDLRDIVRHACTLRSDMNVAADRQQWRWTIAGTMPIECLDVANVHINLSDVCANSMKIIRQGVGVGIRSCQQLVHLLSVFNYGRPTNANTAEHPG